MQKPKLLDEVRNFTREEVGATLSRLDGTPILAARHFTSRPL
jgi:hypothetical protein